MASFCLKLQRKRKKEKKSPAHNPSQTLEEFTDIQPAKTCSILLSQPLIDWPSCTLLTNEVIIGTINHNQAFVHLNTGHTYICVCIRVYVYCMYHEYYHIYILCYSKCQTCSDQQSLGIPIQVYVKIKSWKLNPCKPTQILFLWTHNQ